MPWTASRSRDEWLAEVARRGDRIRRRRRLAAALVGALAVVAPVTVFATVFGVGPEHTVELTAAGVPTTEAAPPASDAPAAAGSTEPAPPAGGIGTPSETPTLERTPVSTTTTVEVHLRVDSVNGRTGPPAPLSPTSSTSVPPADDPVVRPPPTTPPSTAGAATSNGASPAPSTTSPLPSEPRPAACPAPDVRVTVVTDKTTYAPGETVRGTSTLENRSAAACTLPTRAFVRVENAAGKSVGSFAYTTEFRMPVLAEPGRVLTSAFTWDQQDCSGAACVQVPAGAYVVVADWTEAGPYTGRGTFQIGA